MDVVACSISPDETQQGLVADRNFWAQAVNKILAGKHGGCAPSGRDAGNPDPIWNVYAMALHFFPLPQ